MFFFFNFDLIMKVFALVCTSILILISFSCKKKALVYDIGGKVQNTLSGETIGNVKIDLYKRKFDKNVLNNNYIFIESVVTDENGNYSFTIPREKVYDLRFNISNEDYYYSEVIHSQDELKSNELTEFNFQLEAKGWLNLHLNNLSVQTGEQLNLYKRDFKEGCEECCANGSSSYQETTDTVITCAIVGGSTVHIDYGEVIAGSSFSADIFCKPFETTHYIINY